MYDIILKMLQIITVILEGKIGKEKGVYVIEVALGWSAGRVQEKLATLVRGNVYW